MDGTQNTEKQDTSDPAKRLEDKLKYNEKLNTIALVDLICISGLSGFVLVAAYHYNLLLDNQENSKEVLSWFSLLVILLVLALGAYINSIGTVESVMQKEDSTAEICLFCNFIIVVTAMVEFLFVVNTLLDSGSWIFNIPCAFYLMFRIGAVYAVYTDFRRAKIFVPVDESVLEFRKRQLDMNANPIDFEFV